MSKNLREPKQELCRRCPGSKNERRNKQLKINVSEREKKMIQNTVKKWGFQSLRDFILYFSEYENMEQAVTNVIKDKVYIALSPISTCVNMIHAGIDKEENYKNLLERSDKLFHKFKF